SLCERGFAVPEPRELAAQTLNEIEIGENEVDPLLPGKPAHHAKEQRIRLARKPKVPLQRGLVQAPPCPRPDRIRRHKPCVLARIPYGLVDSVENSNQRIRACAQQPIKPHAILGGAYFGGIGGRYGGDLVGET